MMKEDKSSGITLKYIGLLFGKTLLMIIICLLWAVVWLKVFPPPKGNGFDNIGYVIAPFFLSIAFSFIYVPSALLFRKKEKRIYWTIFAIDLLIIAVAVVTV